MKKSSETQQITTYIANKGEVTRTELKQHFDLGNGKMGDLIESGRVTVEYDQGEPIYKVEQGPYQ